MKLETYLNIEFISSCHKTQQFNNFARTYKNAIKKAIAPKFEIVSTLNGHFSISYFIKNNINNKLAYLSISDVRHFPNSWYNEILIRTAKNLVDYTGGANNYTSYKNLFNSLNNLIG